MYIKKMQDNNLKADYNRK